jgi:hypothetical protein
MCLFTSLNKRHVSSFSFMASLASTQLALSKFVWPRFLSSFHGSRLALTGDSLRLTVPYVAMPCPSACFRSLLHPPRELLSHLSHNLEGALVEFLASKLFTTFHRSPCSLSFMYVDNLFSCRYISVREVGSARRRPPHDGKNDSLFLFYRIEGTYKIKD